MTWFHIDHTLFTWFGYPMSGLEFSGTLLNLWSVWLVSRKSIWTWPVGNVAGVLFALLFYQIQLYSDLLEQIFFLMTNCYGWWLWSRRRSGDEPVVAEGITRTTLRQNVIVLNVMILGTAIMGFFMTRIHLIWPSWFPQAASFPYLDAWTTIMSFIAQILMAHKKLECWWLWVVVDVVGVGLYAARGVIFVSMLYGIFLILALRGWRVWWLTHRNAMQADLAH